MYRPRRHRLFRLIITAAIVVGLVGCTRSDLSVERTSTDLGRRTRPTEPPPPDVDDDVAMVAIDDVERYWDRMLPEVYGIRFEPLAGGVHPYGPRTELPDCGSAEFTYRDIQANALYCPDTDVIAWDEAALIPFLLDNFGPLTVGVVMAHEYGHAIQARAEVEGRVITLELQADCFGGAWAADVDGRIEMFSSDGAALDRAIAGFLELRDELGVPATDGMAHGSGFDRVAAFQDGYEQGPAACATYEDTPPDPVAIPFGGVEDLERGGDLPTDVLLPPLTEMLDSFFTTEMDAAGGTWEPIADVVFVRPSRDEVTCGRETFSGRDLEFASFYCTEDHTIYLDGAGLLPELEDIGDFAVAGEVAREYAYAAQTILGLEGTRSVLAAHADCVVGAFTSAMFHERIVDQSLFLSPGDLDEVVVLFLTFEDSDASAFERTGFVRSGFTDGFGSCLDLVGS